MRARYVPYYVGGFMLLPYAIWLVLWATVIPGPKHGFYQPMSMAMFAVSIPLVAWFFLSNLGFLSNSIAGGNAFRRPQGRWVRWTLDGLPSAALLIGCACVPYLLAAGEPLALAPLPALMGLGIAWAIRRGEAARAHDGSPPDAAGGTRALGAQAAGPGLGRTAMNAVFLLPVVGWMLREAVRGSEEDQKFFALNLSLGAVLVALLFGIQGLFVVALALTPIALLMIVLITRG